MTKIHSEILSFLFPRRCPVCEEIVSPRGALICPDCERQLHFLTEPTCQICGREILADDAELCESCKRHRFLFKRSIALVAYDDVAARSISRIKYTGAREFLDYYGREAVRRRGDELRRMQIDAIVPVPVHPSRKRKRGYTRRPCSPRSWARSSASRSTKRPSAGAKKPPHRRNSMRRNV